MRKIVTTARHNVISLRISDQELSMLKNLREESNQSTSEFLRNALSLFLKGTDGRGERVTERTN
ncbi:hypothetical protein GMSM_34780 [Geomonas sp. Red276]